MLPSFQTADGNIVITSFNIVIAEIFQGHVEQKIFQNLCVRLKFSIR